jgi:MFS family permease
MGCRLRTAREEWRQGWALPLAAGLGYGVAVTYAYSLGIFIAPLEAEFGWSRSSITSGLTIVSFTFLFLAPFVGVLVDRFGARRVALPGLVLYCLGFGSLSLASDSTWTWWALWGLLALGAVCVQAAVWTAAVASRFDTSRGLAIAVTLSGAGLGSSLVPLLANALISSFDWRSAYWMMGLIFVIMVLPPLLLFFHDASDRATKKTGQARAAKPVDAPGLSIGEAIRSRRFIVMALAIVVFVLIVAGLLVHFVPMLTGGGLDPNIAASAAALIGVGAMVGRVAAGFLIDRFSGPKVGFLVFLLPVAALLMLIHFDGTPAFAFATAFILGLALGGEIDVMAYLASRYFGLRNFGTIFSALIGFQTFASGTGPFLAGLAYDSYDSYLPLLYGAIPALIVAAAMVATLGSYPDYGSRAGLADETGAPADPPEGDAATGQGQGTKPV